MGGGPSLDDQLKTDLGFINYVQERQKALSGSQEQNFSEVIASVNSLLNKSVPDTLDVAKELEKISQKDLQRAKGQSVIEDLADEAEKIISTAGEKDEEQTTEGGTKEEAAETKGAEKTKAPKSDKGETKGGEKD